MSAPHRPDPGNLGDAFVATARLMRRGTFEVLEPLGLTPHQSRALRTIEHDGPLRLGALAERLRVAPRSVTDVVDGLEQQGYVERRPDPADRRAVVVAVTATGRRRLVAVERARAAHSARFFAALSETERDELARLLGVLLDAHG